MRELTKSSLLTKIEAPRKIQVTYTHVYVGNKFIQEIMPAFALAEYIEAPTVVTVNVECAFVDASDKIHIPTTKLLIHAAVGNLSK